MNDTIKISICERGSVVVRMGDSLTQTTVGLVDPVAAAQAVAAAIREEWPHARQIHTGFSC